MEAVTSGGCDTTLWDWAMYVETRPEEENGVDMSSGAVHLRKVCASDPRIELRGLTKAPELLSEEEIELNYHVDMEQNIEIGFYDHDASPKWSWSGDLHQSNPLLHWCSWTRRSQRKVAADTWDVWLETKSEVVVFVSGQRDEK